MKKRLLQKVRHQNNRNAGFTLAELLAVIAIMCIVVATTIIGISILSSGDAEQASKNVRSVLNSTRTNTMSIASTWEARIYKDDSQYIIAVYKDGEEYETTELGSRISIKYGESGTDLETGALVITFKRGSGAVESIRYVENDTETYISEETQSFKIIISNSSSDYILTLWRETGKITSGD